MAETVLSPTARDDAIAGLAERELDVLVVGGGVVGTGAVLDAASRRLRAGLVEATDFAAGASSASSKLVHGGVRYLQMLDFGLVREALAERALLLDLAPHLVRPVAFLYPLRRRYVERPYVGTGLALYDALARLGRGRLPRHRHLTASEARRLAPSLRAGRLVGAMQYWDAQVDDARYVIELARTAAGLGAHLVSGARVVGFLDGRGEPFSIATPASEAVRGARVRLESGRELDVRARAVLAAPGAWAVELARLAGAGDGLPLRPSKGVHLVVGRGAIDSQRALVVPTGRSVLFVLPWGAHWLVGTTDTPWRLGPDRPVASRADIDYLLAEANQVLDPPLRREDVEAVYAGLRPLVASSEPETTKASREHAVARLRPGLHLVTGGKYTTYRIMARDGIDAVAGELGRDVLPSATATIPLVGAPAPGSAESEEASRLAARHAVSEQVAAHLLGRYGALSGEVLDDAAGDPALLEQLPGGAGYLVAEARYAASHEGARHLADVLERRTRLAIETADRGWAAAPAVAAAVAPVLGWDARAAQAEIDAYRSRVEAARRAEDAPDDEAAMAAALTQPAGSGTTTASPGA